MGAWTRSIGWGCCTWAAWLAAAQGELGAQEAEGIRVARLVRQLGDPDYARRTEADRQLEALEAADDGALRGAAAAADPEVRRRIERLLARRTARSLWNGSPVDLRAADEPAATVLARLAAESGNRVQWGPHFGPIESGPLRIEPAATTYWQAVDRVCRESGNHFRPHYDTRSGGIVVTSGSLGGYPTAYAGPIRAQITSGRRTFVEELDYETVQGEVTHTLQLNLQLIWEDRFRLVAYAVQPELVEALAGGARVTAQHAGTASWNVATPGTRMVTASMRISPPVSTAGSLDLLRIKWGLIAVGDMVSLELSSLQPGQQVHAEDLALTLLSIDRPSSARCELVLAVARTLAPPEPPEVQFQENEVQLFDTRGRPFRQQGQTHLLNERGVEMKLSFTTDSAESVPERLRFSFPKTRARRELEIEFRDVPLPTARPE